MTNRNRDAHTHPCVVCQEPIECGGTLERNYDGFPETICTAVDVAGMQPVCVDCAEAIDEDRE